MATVRYKTWELPELTARQVVALADEVHRERVASVMAGAAAFDEDVRVRLLRDLDRERGLAADVLRWCYTAAGTVRVVEESLKLLGNGVKLDDLGLDLPNDYRLALRLLGFEPKEPVTQVTDDGDPTVVPPHGGT